MKIDNQDIQISYALPFLFFSFLTFCTADDGDIISISLPPSERGWTVVISKGVHSSSQIRVTENRPGESPALQLSMRTNIFSTDDARCDVEAINVGVKTLDLGSEGRVSIPKSQSLEPPPSHVQGCSPQERFRVAKDIRLKYPPFSVGWRDLSWVVVIRGRDVGVFHEYWCVYPVYHHRLIMFCLGLVSGP